MLVGSRRALGLASASLALLVASACGPKVVEGGGNIPVTNVPDVESRNLAPDEEIDALLKGKPSLGRATKATRVAVPPFQLRARPAVMKEREYLGSSVAELLGSRLTHTTGVSVLERGELTKIIEELKRASGDVSNDSARSLASSAKLVGAQLMLVGSVIERDDTHFHVIVKPVRVEDAVILPTVELDVDAKDLGAKMDDVAKDVLKKINISASGPKPSKSLYAASLAMATRARELQYQGHLAEAQPLYAKALAQPSDAWKLEADYVRTMSDLGMREWALAHSREVLGRMPTDTSVACDRASLTTMQARAIQLQNGAEAVPDAREAVRVAASCGDPVAIAFSLIVYANAMVEVHFPTAMRAYERAETLARGKSAWMSCWAASLHYTKQQYAGDWQGDRSERFAKSAAACEEAGNLRSAAFDASDAGDMAFLPAERTAHAERAVTLAKHVGGSVLDDLLLASASNLREIGKPSEADERILAVLGANLTQIYANGGGGPNDPESRIDDELLKRAKVKRVATSSGVTSEGKLLLAAHRRGLAKALRRWATRTRVESKQQADFYVAIADLADPASETGETDAEKRIAKVLERAKLPLDVILRTNDAPLRGSGADLEAAFGALLDSYDLVGDDSSDKAKDIVAAMKRVASWSDHPRQLRETALHEAKLYLKADNRGAALERVRAARALAKDDPYFVDRALDVEHDIAERAEDGKRAVEIREEQTVLAARVSPSYLVSSVYNAEHAAWNGGRSFRVGVDRLTKLSDHLAAKGAIEPAAYALVQAARLTNDGMRVDGSTQAVQLHVRRVALLDRLEDPLRSLEARTDLLNAIAEEINHRFRGNTSKMLKASPAAATVMADIKKRLDKLVEAGRLRDATRIVSKTRGDAPGGEALNKKALVWAETFKDSAEYPILAGRIHQDIAFDATDDAQKKKEFAIARDLFIKGKSTGDATVAQRNVMGHAESETELWALVDTCWQLAQNVPADRYDCVAGLANYVEMHNNGVEERVLTQKEPLKNAIKLGMESVAGYDRVAKATSRFQHRANIGVLAAQAGDVATFDRLLDDTRTYYTKTQPDAYQLVTNLASYADAAAAFDLKRSLVLWREFDSARGASAYWRGETYFRVAKIAKKANDSDSERFFIDAGRKAAEQSNRELVYKYDLYEARRAMGAKDWKSAAKAYERLIGTLATFNAKGAIIRTVMIANAGAAFALSNDWSAADKVLKPHTELWVKELGSSEKESDAPCAKARALEVAAAIDMKLGQCGEAAQKRTAAEHARRACTEEKSDGYWTEGPGYARTKVENACGKATDLATLIID